MSATNSSGSGFDFVFIDGGNTMTRGRTNIAFVGCAHIHTPGFIQMVSRYSDIAVTRVWDPDRRRSDYRAQQLNAKVSDSVEAILADDSITAVVICSETNRHEQLVIQAAKAGKHMFVEKPLGMTSHDAYAMAQAVEDAGVMFQTGYFQRYERPNRFIKDLINKGALGTITKVRGSNAHHGALANWFGARPDAVHDDWRWMADPTIAGVGAFGDLGAHALDILLWWLGDVSLATAQVDVVTNTYDGTDESGEGLLRFKNGAVGTLCAGWVDVANPVRYMVSGTHGHAALIHDKLYVTSQKDARFDGSAPVRDCEMPVPAPHAFELFLDTLIGRDLALPLVSAREAAYRSSVMEALYEGAKNNTWVMPK
jgi:predicted dehydrogenase